MMTDKTGKPWPSELRVKDKGALLCVTFDNGQAFDYSAEYLRVESPSAEVKGHGPGQEITVAKKRHVTILNVEAVGNYAVKITFSDGHATGLYSWDYLMQLGLDYEDKWAAYLGKLDLEGLARE